MNKITIDDKDFEILLEGDKSELDTRTEDILSYSASYEDRTSLIKDIKSVKEQCDKMITRINEFDNRGNTNER